MPPRFELDPTLAHALDPAERDALLRAVEAADPETRAALGRWGALRRRLRADLRAAVPDERALVLYAAGDEALDPAERARLAAAAERHPGLQAVLDRLAADRTAFEALWDEEFLAPAERLAPARATDRAAARPDRSARRPSRVWRAAVAVAVLAFAAVMVFVAQREPAWDTIRTASGETRLVTFDDGSTAHLAAGTELAYAFRDGERRVRLTGAAVFDVLPADEPFVVETATALTTVLGTTFSVLADAEQTEVVLASGRVALAPRAEPEAAVQLEPGQRSAVRAGQPPEAPSRTDVVESLAWTGTWHFLATPLAEIAALVGAHHGVSVAVPPALAGERVTGAFERDVPVAQTLQTLATALGVGLEGNAASGFRFVERPR